MRRALALLAALALVLGGSVPASARPDEPTPAPRTEPVPGTASARQAPAASPEEIGRLIRELGEEAWARREAATLRLAELGPLARTALEAAQRSPDAEVRYRARLLLRAPLHRIKAIIERVRRGGLDEATRAELATLGASAVPPLVHLIERGLGDGEVHDDDRVRTAMALLEVVASPADLDSLLRLLDRNILQLQGPLAAVLRKAGDAPVRQALGARIAAPVEGRRDAAFPARKNAIDLLPFFPHEECIAPLTAALADPDQALRIEAIEALEILASGGLRADGGFARLGDGPPRPDSPAALLRRGAADALLRALQDPEVGVELRAVQALAAIGERRVSPFLRSFLAAASGPTSTAAPSHIALAIDALAALGEPDAAPAIVPFLEHESAEVVDRAADAVGVLRAPEAIPALGRLLARDDPHANSVALRALGGIGDARAAPAIRRYYLERGAFGALAVDAMGRVAGLEARAFLLDRAKAAKDENEVRVALRRLDARGDDGLLGDDEAAEEAALSALDRGLSGVRADAVGILGRRRHQPAFDAVEQALRKATAENDAAARFAAVEALGLFGDRRAITVLRPIVAREPDGPLGPAAVRALAILGDATSVDAAIERMQKAQESGSIEQSVNIGILQLYARRYADAEKTFASILERSEGHATAAYNLACTHALSGGREKALDWLEKSVAWGFTEPEHMDGDPDLDSLRDEPRYRAVRETLRPYESGRPRGVLIFGREDGGRLIFEEDR